MSLSLFIPKELKKSSSYMYFMKLNSLILHEQTLSKTFSLVPITGLSQIRDKGKSGKSASGRI
jgi:hypothetical protein